jgi:hypothetical protein
MVDFARCDGTFPDGTPCEKRHSCTRYRAAEGTLWLRPKVQDGHCYDYLPELGQRMAEGMGK